MINQHRIFRIIIRIQWNILSHLQNHENAWFSRITYMYMSLKMQTEGISWFYSHVSSGFLRNIKESWIFFCREIRNLLNFLCQTREQEFPIGWNHLELNVPCFKSGILGWNLLFSCGLLFNFYFLMIMVSVPNDQGRVPNGKV